MKVILLVIAILVLPITLSSNNSYSNYAIIKACRWEQMYQALCIIESNNDTKAINHSRNAVGILQIRPIYIKEINRIQKKVKYTLKDRFIPKKCREMFDIFQNYYNFEHNINKAIVLHISGHRNFLNNNIPYWYLNKVKAEMNK